MYGLLKWLNWWNKETSGLWDIAFGMYQSTQTDDLPAIPRYVKRNSLELVVQYHMILSDTHTLDGWVDFSNMSMLANTSCFWLELSPGTHFRFLTRPRWGVCPMAGAAASCMCVKAWDWLEDVVHEDLKWLSLLHGSWFFLKNNIRQWQNSK